jgi:hypothetical protein
MSSTRHKQAGVPQCSILSPTSYNLYINDTPQTQLYTYATERKEGYVPFVNSVKYLGVIFAKKITWRPHIETIEAKVFRTD